MGPASRLEGTRLWKSGILSDEELEALDNAVAWSRTIGANIDLVREGERADHLLIAVEGWSCRYTTTREGGRQLPAVMVPGDVCNLDTLTFDRLDYSVRTLTPATILALPRDSLFDLAARYPGIGRAFAWLAMIENVIWGKWALSLGRRSSKERLAHLLCELSVRLGAEKDGASSFPFPLTQEQIADALGLTPVHVNRTMQLLRGEGLITTASRTMTIADVARLRQIAGFDPRYLHMGPAPAVRSA